MIESSSQRARTKAFLGEVVIETGGQAAALLGIEGEILEFAGAFSPHQAWAASEVSVSIFGGLEKGIVCELSADRWKAILPSCEAVIGVLMSDRAVLVVLLGSSSVVAAASAALAKIVKRVLPRASGGGQNDGGDESRQFHHIREDENDGDKGGA